MSTDAQSAKAARGSGGLPHDRYASARCVNCRHLRYLDEKPGDPCQFCPCGDHRLPGEAVTGHAAEPS